jgi:hypothetical protein
MILSGHLKQRSICLPMLHQSKLFFDYFSV